MTRKLNERKHKCIKIKRNILNHRLCDCGVISQNVTAHANQILCITAIAAQEVK